MTFQGHWVRGQGRASMAMEIWWTWCSWTTEAIWSKTYTTTSCTQAANGLGFEVQRSRSHFPVNAYQLTACCQRPSSYLINFINACRTNCNVSLLYSCNVCSVQKTCAVKVVTWTLTASLKTLTFLTCRDYLNKRSIWLLKQRQIRGSNASPTGFCKCCRLTDFFAYSESSPPNLCLQTPCHSPSAASGFPGNNSS